MRLSIALVLFSIALSAIAVPTPYPPCSQPCLAAAISNQTLLGPCTPTEPVCLCRNKEYVANVTSCIASSCSAPDAMVADNVGNQACLAVGVTLIASTSTAATSAATSAATNAASTTSGTSSAASSTATTSSSWASSNGVNVLALAGAALAALIDL